jgi:RNA recognition motif-containing protein
VQPYGGTGLIGYGNQHLMHDPSTAKAGYHTKRLYLSGLAGVECTEDELMQWLVTLYEERGLEKEEGNPIESLSIHEKGFAFAEMRSSAEATAALSLNGSEFMGHPIKVARPKDYRPGEEDPDYVPGVVSNNVQDTAHKVQSFFVA